MVSIRNSILDNILKKLTLNYYSGVITKILNENKVICKSVVLQLNLVLKTRAMRMLKTDFFKLSKIPNWSYKRLAAQICFFQYWIYSESLQKDFFILYYG